MDNEIYTAKMGQPPSTVDMGSAVPPPAKKKKKSPPVKKEPRGIRGGVWTEDSGLPPPQEPDMGSAERKFKKGGSVSSASKRADGIAKRGHTRGRMM